MTLGNVLNGGFETGDFTGWERIGSVGIQTAEIRFPTGEIVTQIIPTQGNFQASIVNFFNPVSNASLESFLGLNSSAIDGLGNGNATNGSALKKQVTVNAGDVLSFDFKFATTEDGSPSNPSRFNDFAFVSILPSFVSELADTGSILFRSPSFIPGFSFRETDYDNFTFKFTNSGTYTVGIGSVNEENTSGASALFVDNFNIVSASEAILGTDNGESLFGTVGNDTIFGKGGNDQIFGSEGVNHLYGGDGDDTIFGGSQTDAIYGGQGNDTIFAAEGNNIVFGGAGDDTIYTGSGNDKIVGGFGNDTIWLGGGQDVVALEIDKGIDTINNFQLGQTKFDIFGSSSSLSIVDGAQGTEISQFGQLLAVVRWTQANTLINNLDTVFV